MHHQPTFPSFTINQEKGLFKENLGRLPLLVWEGNEISQSKTMERFLGRKFGFMGSNDIEEARIDAFCEHIRDIKQKYQVFHFYLFEIICMIHHFFLPVSNVILCNQPLMCVILYIITIIINTTGLQSWEER